MGLESLKKNDWWDSRIPPPAIRDMPSCDSLMKQLLDARIPSDVAWLEEQTLRCMLLGCSFSAWLLLCQTVNTRAKQMQHRPLTPLGAIPQAEYSALLADGATAWCSLQVLAVPPFSFGLRSCWGGITYICGYFIYCSYGGSRML